MMTTTGWRRGRFDDWEYVFEPETFHSTIKEVQRQPNSPEPEDGKLPQYDLMRKDRHSQVSTKPKYGQHQLHSANGAAGGS